MTVARATERQLQEMARYRAKNRDRLNAAKKVWYAANREKARAAQDAWAAANKERVSAYRRSYHAETREDRLAVQRAWRDANPHVKVELEAARKQVARRAVPWKDVGIVRDLYRLARIHRDAGIDCAVDHVVPLRSKIVTGLHVQTNLTVLLKEANSSKGNRWWPDMPAAGQGERSCPW